MAYASSQTMILRGGTAVLQLQEIGKWLSIIINFSLFHKT